MFLRVCRRFASSEAVKRARVRHSPKTEHLLDQTLRVDHAGEFGAVQIYKGQLAVLGRSDVASTLQVGHHLTSVYFRFVQLSLFAHQICPGRHSSTCEVLIYAELSALHNDIKYALINTCVNFRCANFWPSLFI